MPLKIIAWGGSTQAIRTGSGNAKSAAREAYGTYDKDRMTILPVPLTTMRSDVSRTRFIAQVLLPAHITRMEARNEVGAVAAAKKTMDEITQAWQKEWGRYDRRYKR